MVRKIPLIGARLARKRKAPKPKLLKSGFRTLRKSSRLFNGKRYNRIGSFKTEDRANSLKERFKNKGYHALLIKSGPNIQLWIRK